MAHSVIEALSKERTGSEGRMFKRLVGGHRDDEGLLVLRSAASFATVALSAKVGIVNLHETAQLPGSSRWVMACITLCFKRQAVRLQTPR